MSTLPQRDSSIDFWRGIALVTIFINHIPGNVLERFTHKNHGLSDAAELFVLLAGMSAALAYYPRFEAGRPLHQSFRAAHRAFMLYLGHVATLIAAFALFSIAMIITEDPRLLERIGANYFLIDPIRTIVGVATLGFQPAYFNILPLYIVLLLMLPAIMWLARHDLGVMVGISIGLYLATQAFRFSLPHYPLGGPWFLNPFAWQILFALGFAAGARMRAGLGVPWHPLVFWGAVAYLVLCFASRKLGYWPNPGTLPIPSFLWNHNKQLLSLPRLLHVLALVYVVGHMAFNQRLRVLPVTNPVVLLGRHALPVFCFGSLLSMGGLIMRVTGTKGMATDLLYIGFGLAVMVGLARVLEWHRAATRNEGRARVGVPAPSPAP